MAARTRTNTLSASNELLDDLVVSMGGRVAEEIVFGDVTNGARGDIQMATRLARKMVCEWGMSEKMGMVEYGEHEDYVFLGRDISRARDYSEATAEQIDQEVRKLVDDAYTRAKEILVKNREKLEVIAKALLEFETLDGVQIQRSDRARATDQSAWAAAGFRPEARAGEAAQADSRRARRDPAALRRLERRAGLGERWPATKAICATVVRWRAPRRHCLWVARGSDGALPSNRRFASTSWRCFSTSVLSWRSIVLKASLITLLNGSCISCVAGFSSATSSWPGGTVTSIRTRNGFPECCAWLGCSTTTSHRLM